MSEWQAIETAPIGDDWKDRIYVLMWSDEDGAFVGYAWTIHGKRLYSDHPGCIEGNDVRPTHWMPLPDPPASPQDKGQTE